MKSQSALHRILTVTQLGVYFVDLLLTDAQVPAPDAPQSVRHTALCQTDSWIVGKGLVSKGK